MSKTLAEVEVKQTTPPTTMLIPPTPKRETLLMPKVSAEVEVEQPASSTPTIPPTPRVAPVSASTRHSSARQPQGENQSFWLIALISLLIAGGPTFLVLRRWLKRSA